MENIIRLLTSCRKLEIEIQTQLEHIEQLHRICKSTGMSRQAAVDYAESLAKLERQVNGYIDKLCDRKLEALKFIEALDGEERCVIEKYYLQGKPWKKVAEETYMSVRRVYMLRKSALEKLINVNL